MLNFSQQFTGVERTLEYTQLPKERSLFDSNSNEVPSEWPLEGSIVVENLTIKYRPELDPVLLDFSVVIQGGHNVGIVGRTGEITTQSSSFCIP